MMPRVLVVDDDRMYAEAAAAVLSIDDRLEVVGFAADGRQADDDRRNARASGAHAFIGKSLGDEAPVEAALSAGREAVTR
jgi:CheY-like chemotaxis protein